MRSDPIVDEGRRIRDRHASSFNYEVDAIMEVREGEHGCPPASSLNKGHQDGAFPSRWASKNALM